MNKKVFNKYVVCSLILMTLVWSRCAKNDLIAESECTSNCFEISGKIINRSTNLPESFRRIQVKKSMSSFPHSKVEMGYVVTKSDGTYLVRLNKSSFKDTSDVNLILTLENKNGYINNEWFSEFYFFNLDLNKSYQEDLNVYQEASLNVVIKNTSTDTVSINMLTRYFAKPSEGYYINKLLPPNATYSKLLVTTFGIPTDISVSYKLKGDQNFSSKNASIVCKSDGADYLQIDLN
jgi:hypothetical protein